MDSNCSHPGNAIPSQMGPVKWKSQSAGKLGQQSSMITGACTKVNNGNLQLSETQFGGSRKGCLPRLLLVEFLDVRSTPSWGHRGFTCVYPSDLLEQNSLLQPQANGQGSRKALPWKRVGTILWKVYSFWNAADQLSYRLLVNIHGSCEHSISVFADIYKMYIPCTRAKIWNFTCFGSPTSFVKPCIELMLFGLRHLWLTRMESVSCLTAFI